MLRPCTYSPFKRVDYLSHRHRIDVAIRLRRAIYLNDLTLVQRIVRNNPSVLRNPDFADKSNTSLHLAARCGFVEIAVRPFPLPAVLVTPQGPFYTEPRA